MKNLLFKILAAVAVLCLLSEPFAAQTSACQYSTCVPVIPFTNTDNLQLYGAIKSISGAGGSGTSTVVPQAGSVFTVAQQAGTTLTASGTFSVSSGNVGGFTDKKTVTVTVDGLYASGDNMGGVITASLVIRSGQTTVILNDLEVWDNSAQNANLTIDFWSGSGMSGTFTNNSPTVLGSTDYNYYLGSVQVSSGDYVTTGTRSRASLTGISLTLKNETDSVGDDLRKIYITITTTSTPNYTSNLYLRLGVLQD